MSANTQSLTLMKRALKPEQGYPVGHPAPMYIDCGCGNHLPVKDGYNPCPCGFVYNGQGWVVNSGEVSNAS